MTEPDSPVEEFAHKLAEEYGKWKAKAVILIGNARAFNPGDPVPASHVELYHYDEQGLVEPVDPPAESDADSGPEPPAAEPVQPSPAQEPSEG